MIKKQRILFIFIITVIILGCFYVWRNSVLDDNLKNAEDARKEGKNVGALDDFLFAGALEECGDDKARVHMAKILLESGDQDAARGELAEVANGCRRNAEICLLLGKIETAGGNYSEADAYYAKAYALDAGEEVFAARIKNFVRGSDFSSALNLLNNDDRLDKGMVDYYRGLIKFNKTGDCEVFSDFAGTRQNDDMRLAEELCHNLQDEKSVNSSYISLRKADLFNKIREPDFAFAVLQEILAKNPDYRDALMVMGKTYLIEGEYAKAAEVMEKCAALDSNNRETFFYLAEIYDRLGNMEKSMECKEKYEYLAER